MNRRATSRVAIALLTLAVVFLLAGNVSRRGHSKSAGLPPTRVTVDFSVWRASFPGRAATLDLYVRDLAARFEARLIASRAWPDDVRVTGITDGDGCGKSSCSSTVPAHMQVRSSQSLSPDAVKLALGLGTMTFERVTDPTPHPCASGDTAHIAIVHSAVGQSGCLVVDQYTLRVLGYVDVEAPCDPSSQTMIPSSAPLFTVQGADARWLGQWATQHPNAELVLMIDWTAVGVFKMAQTHVKYPTTTLAGYTVQSQMACGISTVTSRAGRPDALASGYTVH